MLDQLLLGHSHRDSHRDTHRNTHRAAHRDTHRDIHTHTNRDTHAHTQRHTHAHTQRHTHAHTQDHKHEFVNIGVNTSFSDPSMEAVDIRHIQDKFPEKNGGLKDLFDKGPQDRFFLIKFWVCEFIRTGKHCHGARHSICIVDMSGLC